MKELRCIIVEDEPLAAQILTDYIREVPFLKLEQVCTDALYAMEYLKNNRTDVIFLDIHLPKLKGLDFLKTMKQQPQVIITSAYNEYAIQGYEYNVVDYLLKPIEFIRFIQAVNKLQDQHKTSGTEAALSNRDKQQYYFFNVDKKQVKVAVDDILYIESLKDYVRIHTENKKLVTKFQIGEINHMLAENNFIRIHKSYIVNTHKISAFNAISVEIGNISLPIGRTYKESVEMLLKSPQMK